MPTSVDQLGKAIVAAGLMPADELKALWGALAAGERPKDGKTFASLLVRQGKLTEFQSQELLSGSGTPLVLGDYVLLSKIGAGGMGQVFKAQHRHMERLVAIKLLPAAMTKDEDSVKRFQREVKAAAKLSHPNIVHATDAGVQRGVWFLVMEYVEGRDLSALVKDHGPFSVQDAVGYILQAARGLAYAHAKGVIHRDIKPANLLLDTEGTVKILDMGLARFDNSGDAADHQLTNTGQVMGTVDYMAPEQAASTHDADARSDIYSLGCALFRLLTGGNVYEGDTVVKKILAHTMAPIPSLADRCQETPAEIDRIFQKMVAKAPADRYQQTTQLVADLEAFLNSDAAAAYPGPTRPETDGKPSNSLRSVNRPGVKQQTQEPPTKAALENEQTVALLGSEFATDPQSETFMPVAPKSAPATRGAGGKNKPPLTLIAGGLGGGLLLLILLGIWVIVKNKNGKEVARIEVPDGGTVVVQNDSGSPTKPPAAVKPAPAGKQPPLAVAPFDAEQAKSYQKAWADYLGLPVEKEVELPGGEKLALVLVPPGEFLMGSTEEEQAKFLEEARAAEDPWAVDRIPNEGPQHRVQITKPYYLGRYEVTQAQWQSVMESNPSRFQTNPSQPVEMVSWADTEAFLARLNESLAIDRLNFALPTEAQWEYACRAGTTAPFCFGESEDDLREYGWFKTNSKSTTHPVGELKANVFGLNDMHGNVWEWCSDRFGGKYSGSPAIDPAGSTNGAGYVNRGGGFSNPQGNCRSAHRTSYVPDRRLNSVGFRLAATIDLTPLKTRAAADQPEAPASDEILTAPN